MEDAVAVAHEIVAGQVPTVAHVLGLARVGEIAAAGRPAHGEMADGAVGHVVHVVVDDPRLVAGDRPAGGARARHRRGDC